MNIRFFKFYQIGLINIFVIICFILGYGKFGDLIYDSFREIYIPAQMLDGQVLYKNIFNIYAPFAYIFNAFLVKIFGVKLNVFYISGLLTTIGIVNLIYAISHKFIARSQSLIVVFFFICAAVLSPNVFNCFLPYSYGMLYGLLFILSSILCILNNKYTLAYVFYSLAICSKYEFILLLPLLLFVSWKYKSIKHILALFVPIIIMSLLLFMQGVRLEHVIAFLQIIISMGSTRTLYWFYSISGLVFHIQLIPLYLLSLCKTVIPVASLYFFKSLFLLPIVLLYSWFAVNPEILIYIFPLILVLFIIRRNSLTKNEKIFVIASLLISIKVFFALILLSYGVYFIPFALISFLILIPKKLRKVVTLILLFYGLVLGFKNVQALNAKNVKIQTQIGTIYSTSYPANSINSLIKYIENNTSEEDRVVIYPECLAVNVMLDRKSDNKFYSLIPLYVETFGEELIIKRLEKLKPEFIVIGDNDTSNYYYSYFGVDYASRIFDYISKNYEQKFIINGNLKFVIYKLKSHHLSQKHA